MAIDISTSDSFGISGDAAFDTEEYKWLLANAPTYGWHHPSWAKRTGSKPEPWHWELTNQSSYIKKDPK
jgi:LAS superfamily LD-carboxypeptidase LdcB